MLEYWLLPAIILLGAITTYEDIRFGKIRNKWIYFALGYVFVIYHALFYFFRGYSLTIVHFYAILLNGILALVIGVLLWRLQLWTAGDAKLFFCFSLLVPPILAFGKPVITVMDLLINTFVPLGAYLVFSSLEKTSLSQKAAHFKNVFEARKFIFEVLFLFVLIWPLRFAMQWLNISGMTFMVALIIAILLRKYHQYYQKWGIYALSVLVFARLLFDPYILTAQSWINFGILVLLFIVLRFFVLGIGQTAFSREVQAKDLKEGMMPAVIYLRSGKKWIQQRAGLPVLPQGKQIYAIKAEGLTKEDIQHIKSAKIGTVLVQETLSFAPFIFIGVLLQIFLQDNVVAFARTAILIWTGA